MAQQRLTEAVREAILRNVIQTTYRPKEEELQKLRAALGDACYHTVYSSVVQADMYRLPKGFLPEDTDMFVMMGAAVDELPFSPDEKESRRIASKHAGHRAIALQLPEDSPLALRYKELKESEEKLKADKASAQRTAKAVLRSARTYEKLLEVWPEVEPFARPFRNQEAKAVSFSLALPIADLNTLLGLKK